MPRIGLGYTQTNLSSHTYYLFHYPIRSAMGSLFSMCSARDGNSRVVNRRQRAWSLGSFCLSYRGSSWVTQSLRISNDHRVHLPSIVTEIERRENNCSCCEMTRRTGENSYSDGIFGNGMADVRVRWSRRHSTNPYSHVSQPVRLPRQVLLSECPTSQPKQLICVDSGLNHQK